MFGKKTAADVLKLFELLSDEEKAKVLEGLKQPDSTNEEEFPEADEHTAEQNEENGAAEQTSEDIDGNAGEQEQGDVTDNNAGSEADTPAPETPEPAETEEPVAEPASSEVDYGEVTQALAARLSSLEEKFSALEQKLADDVAKDNDQDFGSSPSLPTHDDGSNRMAEVMTNYAGANARKYY